MGIFHISIDPINTVWLQVESRIRYNVWDLLGDVGGFSDGLILVCSLYMSLYAAIAFKADYLNGQYIDAASESAAITKEKFVD